MKYEERVVQFVRCHEIDNKLIHESVLEDGVCKECIEFYETLTDDMIDDWVSDKENRERSLIDFHEVANGKNSDFPRMLTFGFWSVPA